MKRSEMSQYCYIIRKSEESPEELGVQVVYAYSKPEADMAIEYCNQNRSEKNEIEYVVDLPDHKTHHYFTPFYVSETRKSYPWIVRVLMSLAYTFVTSWAAKLIIIWVSEGIYDLGADRLFDHPLFTCVCWLIGILVGLHIFRSDKMFEC